MSQQKAISATVTGDDQKVGFRAMVIKQALKGEDLKKLGSADRGAQKGKYSPAMSALSSTRCAGSSPGGAQEARPHARSVKMSV
jgi:hypothetical protein